MLYHVTGEYCGVEEIFKKILLSKTVLDKDLKPILIYFRPCLFEFFLSKCKIHKLSRTFFKITNSRFTVQHCFI